MSAPISDERHDQAVALIRALCSVAGDADAVIDTLNRVSEIAGYEEAVQVCLAALAVTFGECMSHPISPDSRDFHTVPIPA